MISITGHSASTYLVSFSLGALVVLVGAAPTQTLAAVICVPSSFDGSCTSDEPTIQDAVDAAAASGDTVKVDSGTYVEQVLIKGKSLTLVGAGKSTTTIEAPAKASRVDEVADHGFGSRTYDYLVGVFGTGSETVSISGFTLDGKFDAKISGPGTFRSQQLTFLNASGTIEENSLIDWQDSGSFGVQGVATLVVGSLTAETVAVRNNMISGYQKGGIVAFGTGAVTVTIEGNVVTGAGPITTTAQNGIQISNGAGGSIIGNTSTGANFTGPNWCSAGILIFAVDGIIVRNNLLSGSLCDLLAITNGSTFEGNQIPAALDFPFSIIGSSNIITGNLVNGCPFEGMYIDGTGNVLTCNRVTSNGTGIFYDTFSTIGTPNDTNMNSIFGNGTGVVSVVSTGDPKVDATDNWWGCIGGPGSGGCDTAVGHVDVSSPASAPPACVACSSNEDCDDTLACNGAETCNTETEMCESGTPVDCSAQCLGDCVEPSGTCELLAEFTPCNTLADLCSELDTCDGEGTCDNTGGGGDGEPDGTCELDDNCPGESNPDQADHDSDGLGDACDPDLICPSEPKTSCLAAGKSQLQIRDQNPEGPSSKDSIVWKWQGGGLSQEAFGDPVDPNGTHFKLCIYAGATPSLVVQMQVRSGGTCVAKPCWKSLPGKGYKYRDHGIGPDTDGVRSLQLRSKIKIQGKGNKLPLPTLPLDTGGPVVSQLSSSDPSLPCYEETFTQADVTKNEPEKFKAKTP